MLLVESGGERWDYKKLDKRCCTNLFLFFFFATRTYMCYEVMILFFLPSLRFLLEAQDMNTLYTSSARELFIIYDARSCDCQ